MEIITSITGYLVNHWIDLAGYVASLLVAASFYMKTIIPLRIFAILSNVFFVVYGYFGGLYPVLFLHIFLFPLNIFRLSQMKKLVRDVRHAFNDEDTFALKSFALKSLVPYMSEIHFKKGDILFKKGDPADKMYYIGSGSIKLDEYNVDVGEGQIIGEMGIFSPYKERTDTAICSSDVLIFEIDEGKIKELYYQNPEFGFYLIKLLTKRFIANYINKMNTV